MAVKRNTAEGGSNGTGVTTGNSGGASGDAFSSVTPGTGGTIAYDNAGQNKGALGITFTQATAANNCFVRLHDDANAATSFSARVYFKLSGLPSATMQFGNGFTTASDGGLVRTQLTTAGRWQLVGGATTGTTSNASFPISAGTWYRMETYSSGLNGSAGSAQCDVYTGDGTTPLVSFTVSAFTTSGTCGRAWFGKQSSATLAAWSMDDFAFVVGSSTPLGPAVQTIVLSQPVETDAPLSPIVVAKLRTLGQPSDAELAQSVLRVKQRLAAQVTEADVAQAVAAAHLRVLGQPADAELGQLVGRLHVRTLAQPAEVDAGQPVARIKRRTTAQATESDLAQAIARAKRRLCGQPAEGDVAQPLGSGNVKIVKQAAEGDLAQPVARRKVRIVGQAVEGDLAQSVRKAERGLGSITGGRRPRLVYAGVRDVPRIGGGTSKGVGTITKG